jgi:hypothetical protein
VIRLAKDFVPLVEQHEAHAPRVRTDGDDLFAERFSGEREAILDFCPESQHAPAHRFAERNRAVGGTIDFFETKLLAAPDACHDAPTLHAEIHCQINFLGHSQGPPPA